MRPFQRFGIDAPVAPEEVRRRLLEAVAPRKGSVRDSDLPFSGTVGTRSFEIRLVLGYFLPGYRNSFAPMARGSFASGVAGTRVEVRLRPHLAVIAFEALWFSIAIAWIVLALVYAARDPTVWWVPSLGLAFLAVGYLFMILPFSHEARRMRESLERVLIDAVPASELPRSTLSWLFDLKLRNAELSERRFNAVFLATYLLSGAIVVFNWERTVTACSNEQYRRGEEFSCPSEGRIALAWGLGGVLVAAGFGSRFALHRRLRHTYFLLLLAVIAIGAAAAWMLTHHSRWGISH